MDEAQMAAGILAGVQYLKSFVPKEHHKIACPILAVVIGAVLASYFELKASGTISFASILGGAGMGIAVSGSLGVASEYQKKGSERNAEAILNAAPKVTKAEEV